MPLERIEIEGYKSIRSAKIELGRINVLIGANGAGKSNLLDVFGLLSDLADRRLQFHVARAGGANAILHFGRKQTTYLRLRLLLNQHSYEAVLVPTASDKLMFDSEQITPGPGSPALHLSSQHPVSGDIETWLSEPNEATEPFLTAMRTWRRFHFYDTGPSAPAKQKHKLDDNRALRSEEENLASFLFALKKTAPGAYRRIVAVIHAVAPFFEDFVLEPDVVNTSVIQLAWRHVSDDALFTADSLSDGTLR